MIVRREKIYTKKDGNFTNTIKRTSYWLFGIIPLFLDNEIMHRRLG